MDKASEIAGWVMEQIDGFTTGSIVRARMIENMQRGMSQQSALEEADQFASGIMADRSKGATPLMYTVRSPISKNHDDYADGSGKAPLTFQMHKCYATQYKMNSSGSNTGGWADCLLRSTGAFKTIKSKMPAEVVAAMKAVTKKTAASGSSSTISTTEDAMFLLSEIEVQGARTHSYAGEGTQYDYYKTAANRNKNDTSWWLRSPRASSTTCFCATRFDGTADWIVASNPCGVAAAWCF